MALIPYQYFGIENRPTSTRTPMNTLFAMSRLNTTQIIGHVGTSTNLDRTLNISAKCRKLMGSLKLCPPPFPPFSEIDFWTMVVQNLIKSKKNHVDLSDLSLLGDTENDFQYNRDVGTGSLPTNDLRDLYPLNYAQKYGIPSPGVHVFKIRRL